MRTKEEKYGGKAMEISMEYEERLANEKNQSDGNVFQRALYSRG